MNDSEKEKNTQDHGWDQNKHHIKLLKILTQNRFIKYEVIGLLVITVAALAFFWIKYK